MPANHKPAREHDATLEDSSNYDRDSVYAQVSKKLSSSASPPPVHTPAEIQEEEEPSPPLPERTAEMEGWWMKRQNEGRQVLPHHQRQNLKTTSANQSAGTLTLMTSQRQHLSFSVLMWGWISNATEALNEKETRVTRGVTSATESEQVQRQKHGGRFRNSNDGSFSLL